MFTMRNKLLQVVALVVLLLASSASWAAVGRVFYVSGGAHVERGSAQVPVEKGMLLQEGDVLVTADDGRVQWRLADDSFFAMTKSSRYQITSYSYPEGGASGSGKKSFLDLLSGGVRNLTGLIAKQDASAYQLKTPVATLGIRGTDYTAVFCGDCSWAAGATAGLHIRVDEGKVVVRNSGGEVEAQAGQYVTVTAEGEAPRIVVTAPAVFLNWLEDFGFRFDLDVDLELPLERIEGCIAVPSPNQPCLFE